MLRNVTLNHKVAKLTHDKCAKQNIPLTYIQIPEISLVQKSSYILNINEYHIYVKQDTLHVPPVYYCILKSLLMKFNMSHSDL